MISWCSWHTKILTVKDHSLEFQSSSWRQAASQDVQFKYRKDKRKAFSLRVFFRKLSILNRYTMIYDDSSRFMMHRFFVLKWLQVKHGSHYWDSTYFEIFWNMKYVEHGWNMCNICWHIWSEKLSPQTFRALNATAWPLRERWGTPCWTPLTGKRPHPMSRAPAKASVLTALLQTCLARCL